MSFGVLTCFMLSFAMEGAIGLFDSCVHGGTKYRDGDYFLPNNTILKTDGPLQCVQCKCRQGLVLCEIENCTSLDCDPPVQNSRLCCSRCPGSAKGPQESSDLVIGTGEVELGLENNPESDCFSNGRRLRNGSTWQPVIGPLGVMACVECRCHKGLIICGRLQCGRSLCPRPRRRLGQCCPVCPAPAAENGRKAICLPKLNEIFVFRTGNNSDRIEYAFLESHRKNEFVKIHSWNLRPKTPADVFTLSTIPRNEFLDRKPRVLGSITKRRFRKYSKREKKLRSNCWAKCLAKIERLERSLVDYYSISAKSRCGDDQVDVAELYESIRRKGTGRGRGRG